MACSLDRLRESPGAVDQNKFPKVSFGHVGQGESMGLVLVTGGAGFIGSHVVRSLIRSGVRVKVLDDFSSGRPENIEDLRDDIDLIEGDITNATVVSRALVDTETIIHLAARPSVFESIRCPIETHRHNYIGTLTLIDLAREANVRRFLYASSAAVYDPRCEGQISEDSPLGPTSPYGVDKLAGEFLLGSYQQLYGISTVAFRFFNVYGEGQDPTSPYSGVVSRFMDAIRSGSVLTIFGDGLQSRDFVYVGDVAEAVTQTLLAGLTGAVVCNVGTGRETSLLDLVSIFSKIFGRQLRVDHAPAKTGMLDTHGLTFINFRA